MSGIALNCLDEIGNKIISALQLDINVRPGFVGAVFQGDELVVDSD